MRDGTQPTSAPSQAGRVVDFVAATVNDSSIATSLTAVPTSAALIDTRRGRSSPVDIIIGQR